VWTEWKGRLTEELYEKTFTVLERGDFRLEARSERVKNVRKKALDILGEDCPATLAKEELKALSTRHLLSNSPRSIAHHVSMLLRLEKSVFVSQITHEMEGGFSNYTICTLDTPGLFSMIAGVMAANGFNILGAQIHTSSNGKVLDILQVNSPQGFVITDETRWMKMEENLRQVIQGKAHVRELVEKRNRPSIFAEKVKPRFPTVIEVDNDVSSDYTVLDIYTHDKVGLLYRITSTLSELGLYIGVSKISTKIDQVADVFYVKDIFGHKITSEEKLDEIRQRLLLAIEED